MKPRQRHQQIIELLLERGSTSLHELCERFQCSGGTIRNDLRTLQAGGHLIRTFAGATIDGVGKAKRAAHLTVAAQNSAVTAVQTIAQRAAEMVRDGDIILVYPGPITEHMADALMMLKSLTVITNDLAIGRRFARNPNYSVVLIGGQLRADCDALDGPAGVAMLETVRANKAFIPCDGVNGAQGFATDDVTSAPIKAAMASNAQTVVMLATADVVGRAAHVSFSALNQAHHLITTTDADKGVIALLHAVNVRVSQCGERMTEMCADCPPGHRWRVGFANLMEGNDFSVAIRQGIEHAAQVRGDVDLILVDNAGDAQTALLNARRLIDARVDLAIEYQLYERTNHAIMDLFRTAGIPVIAVDIPMPGAAFFGADNYRAGRIAGEAATRWIRKHWDGRLDKVVCIHQSVVGPLPDSRIDGQLDLLRAAFAITEDDIVHIETARAILNDSYAAAIQALRNIPWGKKTLFIGIDSGAAMAALGAAEALDRQACTATVSQNVNAAIRRELERRNPMLIGAVDYFPEQYGAHLIRIAADILEGRPVPPAIYTEHKLVTADDVRPLDTHGSHTLPPQPMKHRKVPMAEW